jgi:methylglyoxal synthase
MTEIATLEPERTTQRIECVALVAHDAKKAELRRLVRLHKEVLRRKKLLATRTTGQMVLEEEELAIELMTSGPLGGDLEIGARIVKGDVDLLIFLRDPLTAHPHEPDIQALLKVCDVHEIPVATNLAAAEIALHFLAEHTSVSEAEWKGKEMIGG